MAPPPPPPLPPPPVKPPGNSSSNIPIPPPPPPPISKPSPNPIPPSSTAISIGHTASISKPPSHIPTPPPPPKRINPLSPHPNSVNRNTPTPPPPPSSSTRERNNIPPSAKLSGNHQPVANGIASASGDTARKSQPPPPPPPPPPALSNPARAGNTAWKSKPPPPPPAKSAREGNTTSVNSAAPTSPVPFSERYPPAAATPSLPPALRKETSRHNHSISRSAAVENPPSTSVSSVKHEALKLPSKDALRKQISAPVAPSPTPADIPLRARALSAAVPDTHDDSDYSSVGDYSDNHDFYDPLDAALEDNIAAALAHEADLHQKLVERSTTNLAKNVANGSSNSNSNSDPDTDGSDRAADAMDICNGESDEEGVEGVVRQNSNFSRLSAQSWLTVDSVEEVASSAANAGQPSKSKSSPSSNVRASTSSDNSIADEDNPLNELRPDAAKVLDKITLKRLTDKSVFECCVELLAGMQTYKKKTFRRFGERRIWLSADCTNLCWNSKKDNVESDSIQLQRVAKLKCLEREVAVDVVEGYRVSLLFSTPEEAGLWTRCLSCLIPLQAKVRAPMIYLLKEKDREDFTLEDDVFNGLSLREHFQVNSYAVLGNIKGHSGQGRLAFSRSEKRFVAMRYISRKNTPLLLRSYEEIAVLKRLSHPNIVKHHECLLYQKLGGTFVVSEHVARGTLLDTRNLEGAKPIPENIARGLILEIIAGLEYLHSLSICHADLRPDNILRAVNGTVKLNALGAITHEFTQIQSMEKLTKARLCGKSSAFLPPEMCWKIKSKPAMPHKSYAMDVWAVGAILYLMLYGRVPFAGLNSNNGNSNSETAIQEHIVGGKLRFPRTPETSRNVRNLLKGVLAEKDPRTRIPLAELKMHPWFLEDNYNNNNPRGTNMSGSNYNYGNNSNANNQPIIPLSPYGMQPLVVAPEEVDAAVQVAKVRIPA